MSNVLTFSRPNDYKASGFGQAARRQRPVNLPPHQFYIENDINIAAPAAQVWQMLANPDAICHWDYDIQDILTSHGYSDRSNDLAGTWRMLFQKDGSVQKQIITESLPGQTFAYTTIKGLKSLSPDSRLTIELHIALFRLFSVELEPGKLMTNVTWLNYLEFSKQGLSEMKTEAVMARLDRKYRRNLIYLKWQTENGCHR